MALVALGVSRAARGWALRARAVVSLSAPMIARRPGQGVARTRSFARLQGLKR
jgi:hypothetical protein